MGSSPGHDREAGKTTTATARGVMRRGRRRALGPEYPPVARCRLTSAVACFAEQGFEATTTRDIGTGAGAEHGCPLDIRLRCEIHCTVRFFSHTGGWFSSPTASDAKSTVWCAFSATLVAGSSSSTAFPMRPSGHPIRQQIGRLRSVSQTRWGATRLRDSGGRVGQLCDPRESALAT
jgi:hypothetical protein